VFGRREGGGSLLTGGDALVGGVRAAHWCRVALFFVAAGGAGGVAGGGASVVLDY